MDTIVVQRATDIARPIDVVRRQFVDMEHHSADRVHAELEVANVRREGDKCVVTGKRRVFGMLQQDELEVTTLPDGNSTLRSVAGTNVGLVVSQYFEALSPEATRVTIKVEFPLKGAMKLLKPLVRMGLERDTDAALKEDKADLEQRYML